ncbi:hypothetical protein, partial [Escherichia coli]|uniref:hypothetical protein n=1 Tax=Escherichia coli TaxID=562 RepID=UPI001BD40ACC
FEHERRGLMLMNPEPSLNPICRGREIGIALSYRINLKNVKFCDKKNNFHPEITFCPGAATFI